MDKIRVIDENKPAEEMLITPKVRNAPAHGTELKIQAEHPGLMLARFKGGKFIHKFSAQEDTLQVLLKPAESLEPGIDLRVRVVAITPSGKMTVVSAISYRKELTQAEKDESEDEKNLHAAPKLPCCTTHGHNGKSHKDQRRED